jgi:uncharacterized membrane protein
MTKKNIHHLPAVERLALKITESVGSPTSIIIHSILFVVIFALKFFGISFESILLILTTAVSLEAIYLSIFIQMTVNRNTQSLEEVEEDIDEIQKDVDEIQEDVDEVQKDIDEIQVDVDEIQKDVDSIEEDITEEEQTEEHEKHQQETLRRLEATLQKLLSDVETLKK